MSLKQRGKYAPRRKYRLGLRLLLFAGCVIALLLYLDSRGWPVAEEIARHQLQAQAQTELQQAAAEVISAHREYRDYRDLVYIEQGEDGQVLLLMPDTLTLNLLISDVVNVAQARLNTLQRHIVHIPLGAFGGLRLLQAAGPQVPVALIGGGVVTARVEDELHAVGINQSRHSIRLQLQAEMQLLSPLVEDTVKVESTLLLAESVIVGPVPQVYWGTDGLICTAGAAE